MVRHLRRRDCRGTPDALQALARQIDNRSKLVWVNAPVSTRRWRSAGRDRIAQFCEKGGMQRGIRFTGILRLRHADRGQPVIMSKLIEPVDQPCQRLRVHRGHGSCQVLSIGVGFPAQQVPKGFPIRGIFQWDGRTDGSQWCQFGRGWRAAQIRRKRGLQCVLQTAPDRDPIRRIVEITKVELQFSDRNLITGGGGIDQRRIQCRKHFLTQRQHQTVGGAQRIGALRQGDVDVEFQPSDAVGVVSVALDMFRCTAHPVTASVILRRASRSAGPLAGVSSCQAPICGSSRAICAALTQSGRTCRWAGASRAIMSVT